MKKVAAWCATLIAIAIMCPAQHTPDPKSPGIMESPPPEVPGFNLQETLERVFGDVARMDPQMRAQVLAGKPGQRHYVDRNHDGKPEEVWFVDTDRRHPEKFRPVLVKVIDRDGDLKMGGEPDQHDDVYVVDWNADGKVDAVLEYIDLDGDKAVDQMVMYFTPGDGRLYAMLARDVGHDHRLWYDVAYIYSQKLSQYRSHFGGDEEFVIFTLDTTRWVWVPNFEDPFVFYDRDGDGVTEETIRVRAEDGVVKTVRHSFDADNAGTLDNPRSFDVSISALAPPGLRFGDEYAEQTTIRGIRTLPFLRYDLVPSFLAPVIWDKVELTWNENDHNISTRYGYLADRQERWEGVINCRSDEFPAVGGPTSGPFNKRYEVVRKPSEAVSLYYQPADHRIHLFRADRTWMDIDADMDSKPEMHYEMKDTDGDGVIDTWTVEFGGVTDSWRSTAANVTKLRWIWPDIYAFYSPILREVPAKLFALDQRLEMAIRSMDGSAPGDPIFKLVRSNFESPDIPPDVRKKFMFSEGTLRFYLDVIKDRLICGLKQREKDTGFWKDFDVLRGRGDYDAMRQMLESRSSLRQPLETYSEWVTKQRTAFESTRVGWAQDWLPPNIGWESEKAAYRSYWGQFDFFGKKGDRLIYQNIRDDKYHVETDWGIDALHVGKSAGAGGVTLYVNGHAYPVRDPDGKRNSPSFEKRFLSANKERLTIELQAKGVGPVEAPYEVRYRCSSLAGRPDSPIEVTITGGRPGDDLELGIGLTKLKQEVLLLDTEAGVLGSWGAQSPVIGTIGMGIIYPAEKYLRFVTLPDENQVVVKAERNTPLVYHIQCDWLRGRRFPVAPNGSDWLKDLRRTAAIVRQAQAAAGTGLR